MQHAAAPHRKGIGQRSVLTRIHGVSGAWREASGAR
jgi:hypothetical protein